MRTAYRIETARLQLRCWQPDDVDALAASIQESRAHLLPWMPWAHREPLSREERAELLRSFRGRFDLDHDHVYGIFDKNGCVVGSTGLHPRAEEDAREIGYWLHVDACGNGYATEATAALTRVAFELLEMKRVELWVAIGNTASRAIPLRLGYSLEGVLRKRRESVPGVKGDLEVFTLLHTEYADSPSKLAEIRCFDVVGEELPLD